MPAKYTTADLLDVVGKLTGAVPTNTWLWQFAGYNFAAGKGEQGYTVSAVKDIQKTIDYITMQRERIELDSNGKLDPESEYGKIIQYTQQKLLHFVGEKLTANVAADALAKMLGTETDAWQSFEPNRDLFKQNTIGQSFMDVYTTGIKSQNWGAFLEEAIMGGRHDIRAGADEKALLLEYKTLSNSLKRASALNTGVGRGRVEFEPGATVEITTDKGIETVKLETMALEPIMQMAFLLHKVREKMRNFLFLTIYEEASGNKPVIHFSAIVLYIEIWLEKVLYAAMRAAFRDIVVDDRNIDRNVYINKKGSIKTIGGIRRLIYDVRFAAGSKNADEEYFVKKLTQFYLDEIGLIQGNKWKGPESERKGFFAALREAEGFMSMDDVTIRTPFGGDED